MPRTGKRMQAPAAPQEQGYGVRGEQIAAQNQMGIPDNTGVAPSPAGPVPGGPPPPGGEALAGPQDVLAMLQQTPPPPAGGLARPSERPEEALMTGEDVEPVRRNVAADALEQMAEATGDPRFTALAQRARMV